MNEGHFTERSSMKKNRQVKGKTMINKSVGKEQCLKDSLYLNMKQLIRGAATWLKKKKLIHSFHG